MVYDGCSGCIPEVVEGVHESFGSWPNVKPEFSDVLGLPEMVSMDNKIFSFAVRNYFQYLSFDSLKVDWETGKYLQNITNSYKKIEFVISLFPNFYPLLDPKLTGRWFNTRLRVIWVVSGGPEIIWGVVRGCPIIVFVRKLS